MGESFLEGGTVSDAYEAAWQEVYPDTLGAHFQTSGEQATVQAIIGVGVGGHLDHEFTIGDLRGLSFIGNQPLQTRVAAEWNALPLETRQAIVRQLRRQAYLEHPETYMQYYEALSLEDGALENIFPDNQDQRDLFTLIREGRGEHLKCDFFIVDDEPFGPYHRGEHDDLIARWNRMPRVLRRKIAFEIVLACRIQRGSSFRAGIEHLQYPGEPDDFTR